MIPLWIIDFGKDKNSSAKLKSLLDALSAFLDKLLHQSPAIRCIGYRFAFDMRVLPVRFLRGRKCVKQTSKLCRRVFVFAKINNPKWNHISLCICWTGILISCPICHSILGECHRWFPVPVFRLLSIGHSVLS